MNSFEITRGRSSYKSHKLTYAIYELLKKTRLTFEMENST